MKAQTALARDTIWKLGTAIPTEALFCNVGNTVSHVPQVINPLFIEQDAVEIQIRKTSSGGGLKPPTGTKKGFHIPDEPSKYPLREVQLSAPSGIVEYIYFRHDHFFEMIEPAGADAETYAAIAYALAKAMQLTQQGQHSFEVPERVAKLLCGARYRGEVLAFLEPMMVLHKGSNEMPPNKDLPLWPHLKLNHARRNRITFVPCPLGGDPLQISLTYSANASWENGRLSCPPKPACEIQEVLNCLGNYLSDPKQGFGAHRARYRVRQRELDARKHCRNRLKRRQEEAPPGERN